ncbi:OmpA family protein [Xenophilus arseniciresistens]|uniref:OmpA family protein n=1 Tax=Xenophilus arseniciresistens TaxID=1283306 RepID=A0AAE3NB66_9BURK|nr:OmpA family protein [Xenophilus arseniciresistens]MDA7418003.1 OmpA family protein [Xenophilus arseniciresistens]
MVRLEKLLRTPAAQPCELEMMIVVGHADVAEAAFNELHGLSCRRANRVKDQLVRLGIPLDRIFVEGFGARQLVDEVGSTRNRRVEIEAVGMINSCRFRRNEASSTAGSTCMDVP